MQAPRSWIRFVLLVAAAAWGQSAPAVPQNLDELWAGYDPRKAPLEVEVTKQWEQNGAVVKIVRYTVDTFKGKKAIMAAVYGYPKGASKVPAIVDLHGGGQAASLPRVLSATNGGYACISINWGGNKINLYKGPEYDGPNTDWGALDATHPQRRSKTSHFQSLAPNEYTLEAVESPRNSNWYVVLIAARRAVTFLEQQPEVDAERMGVQGHSMGGKLTTNLIAIEPRLKAAVPSCGGAGSLLADADVPGGRKKDISELEMLTIADNAYLPRIDKPILWLSPTNDFNGQIDNMAVNWAALPDERVRFSITPHMNHRHADAFAVTPLLWFEQHLKGAFTMPATPKIELELKTADGVPMVTVTPDFSQPAQAVDIFYSIDPHTYTRFWRDAGAVREGDKWTARCPVMSDGDPFFVFANVSYPLPEKYQSLLQKEMFVNRTKVYTISSRMRAVAGEAMRAAGVKPTDQPQTMIDDGNRGWKDWYLLSAEHAPLWQAWTRKIKDPKWRGPDGAKLVFEMAPEADNTVVVSVENNGRGAFPGKPTNWTAVKRIKGGAGPQTISVSVEDFQPADAKTSGKLENWRIVTELGISPSGEYFKDGQVVKIEGKRWEGSRQVRNLRWE